jgi:hypothetical protein
MSPTLKWSLSKGKKGKVFVATYKITIVMTVEGEPGDERHISKSVTGLAEAEFDGIDVGPSQHPAIVQTVDVTVEELRRD